MEPPWRLTLADMLFGEFSSSIQFFRDVVILPVIERLNSQASGDLQRVLNSEEYRRALGSRETRKALTLALAGLWESQFREHMWKSVAVLGREHGVSADEINDAQITRLEKIFLKLRGFPLGALAPYSTISALVAIANAARHGNGRSSERAFSATPQYFSASRPHAGWYSYFQHGATGAEDVRHIDVTDAQLMHFADEIIAFWAELRERARKAETDSE